MKKTHNWQFWDWKSILRAFLLLSCLSLVLVFVFLFPDWNRERQTRNYPHNVTGTILSIEPLERISMDHDGNKTVSYTYSIRYSFKVKSRTYEVTEQVPATIKIKKALNNLKSEDKVKVRYDVKNPRNCLVVL